MMIAIHSQSPCTLTLLSFDMPLRAKAAIILYIGLFFLKLRFLSVVRNTTTKPDGCLDQNRLACAGIWSLSRLRKRAEHLHSFGVAIVRTTAKGMVCSSAQEEIFPLFS